MWNVEEIAMLINPRAFVEPVGSWGTQAQREALTIARKIVKYLEEKKND